MDSRGATTRMARGGRGGFTLIEMGLVLIILGIVVALVLPIVGDKLKQDKLAKGRDTVNALKQELIGYARTHMKMPGEGTVESNFSNVRDGQQNYIAYYVDPILKTTDICSLTSTSYALEVYDTASASVTATYANLAFIIASRGANQNLEINSASGGTAPASRTVRMYNPGANNVDVANTDPPNTTKGPYDYATADTTIHFDDLVEYVSLANLQSRIGCTNADTPIGAAVGFNNVSQDFAKGARNFSAAGSTDVLTVNAKSLSLGNEQSDAAACVWCNATVPDANMDGVWDNMTSPIQNTQHGLINEHMACRTNSGPDNATGGNDAVYCFGYNNANNPGGMTPWTSIAAVFKLSTLYSDTSQGSQDYSGGFVFSLIAADGDGDATPCENANDNCDNTAPCSDENAGGSRGPYLGYSDNPGTSGANTIHPPKIGVEVDFYPDNTGVTDRHDPDAGTEAQTCNQNPMTASNHVAVAYYTSIGGISASDDNQHGAAIPMTGSVTANPPYAPEHPSANQVDCSQETAGIDGFATNATAWSDGSRHKQWLEDTAEHWVRVQIDRNVSTHVYVVHVWLDDTPNNTFLNVDRVNGPQMPQSLTSADYYENSTVVLPAGDDTRFNYFRFGWTFGFGATGAVQTINLSKFGLNATR